MAESEPTRKTVILAQLDQSYEAYRASRRAEIAAATVARGDREKFAGIRGLAEEMLSKKDWSEWQDAHPDVRFLGTSMGDAIMDALTRHTINSAFDACESAPPPQNALLSALAFAEQGAPPPKFPTQFNPWMTADDFVTVLEEGGFEFRSITPLREVNAALMKLDGVDKADNKGTAQYKLTDATELLEKVKKALAARALK